MLYWRALEARHQTLLANVPSKAHFGIGRAVHCLARAGAPGASVAQARAELQQVVDAYAPDNQRLKDWAIEAHAALAGIALLEEQFAEAARSFDAAIALSQAQTHKGMGGETERRRLFCRNLGRAHAHLGRVPVDGSGLGIVTAEPACQEQFRGGYALGLRGA